MTRRYGRPFLFSLNKILNESPKKVTKFHDVLPIKMVDFGPKEILKKLYNFMIFGQIGLIIAYENDQKWSIATHKKK